MSIELSQFIQDMPKAELHVHLEGTIQPETLLQLAEQNHLLDTLPTDNIEALRDWFTFIDFPHFVEVILIYNSVNCLQNKFSV